MVGLAPAGVNFPLAWLAWSGADFGNVRALSRRFLATKSGLIHHVHIENP